jgi:hypothetical protein
VQSVVQVIPVVNRFLQPIMIYSVILRDEHNLFTLSYPPVDFAHPTVIPPSQTWVELAEEFTNLK